MFRDNGYHVVNVSRHRGGFEQGAWIQADLSEPDWLEHIAPRLIGEVQHAGEVVIVHNAAALVRDSIEHSRDAELGGVFQANVMAPIQLNRLLLPYMDAGSSIVYIGSSLSETAVPGRLSYVVSKHAQIGLMRATALEIAGRDMHTVCVCPGITDTEMARQHFGGDDDSIEPFVLRNVLLKRALRPEEIARLIYFCATTQSVNGSIIRANLGRSTV
jgi:NAD(P)-dependent dehydrogenase (short-subunit alcohol dehydrogenase family)